MCALRKNYLNFNYFYMNIHQFYDNNLSHASYAILSGKVIALVDPGRDPQPYYDFAAENEATITHVLETHPHADFISSHLQIHKDIGAEILANELTGSQYPYTAFNNNHEITLGDITIQALHTPGHSPDSNSYLATDPHTGKQALFSGDFLFIGDVGRPDLRENVGNIHEARKDLAEKMYVSVTTVLPSLSDDVIIYPAHGAGSLCGKNLSKERQGTLGNQRKTNWALQDISRDEFVSTLLADQPYIPKYFTHCVETNRVGADSLDSGKVASMMLEYSNITNSPDALVIDTRASELFRGGSHEGALNIPASPTDTFETWLGSIISPDESFFMIVESEEEAKAVYMRTAKIGYEKNIIGFVIADKNLVDTSVKIFPEEDFKADDYLILDIRQPSEHEAKKAFDSAANIPLSTLRESIDTLPTDKPIIVHCAGGYRSAIGSSIIAQHYPEAYVYDMSVAIKNHFNA